MKSGVWLKCPALSVNDLQMRETGWESSKTIKRGRGRERGERGGKSPLPSATRDPSVNVKRAEPWWANNTDTWGRGEREEERQRANLSMKGRREEEEEHTETWAEGMIKENKLHCSRRSDKTLELERGCKDRAHYGRSEEPWQQQQQRQRPRRSLLHHCDLYAAQSQTPQPAHRHQPVSCGRQQRLHQWVHAHRLWALLQVPTSVDDWRCVINIAPWLVLILIFILVH